MGVKEVRKLIIYFFVLTWGGSILVSGQMLTIANVIQNEESLEIEIVFENTTDGDLFILVQNPRSKTKTNYFLTADEKNGMLEIRRHFYFFPPEVVTGVEYPCFALNRIKSKEVYSETVLLKYPVSPTYLFFDTSTYIGKFTSFSFQLGVLPFDESVTEILDKRPFGRCVNGQEIIPDGVNRGQSLFELQRIVKASKDTTFQSILP